MNRHSAAWYARSGDASRCYLSMHLVDRDRGVRALRRFDEVKLAVWANATVTMSLSAREIRRGFLFLDEHLIDLFSVSGMW
jgi:hypothetical protein